MIKYINNYDFYNWLKCSTIDCESVLELGAGFFQNLNFVHNNVKIKTGIEIWQPYIDNSKSKPEVIKIQGDLRNYKNLSDIRDCVILADILEHFERNEAINLFNSLKTDFRKICLMIPKGVQEQSEDLTGYGAHEYQQHRSFWYEQDLIDLGFTEIIVDNNFHSIDHGCMFAVLKKE
jgi:hypothetical protein